MSGLQPKVETGSFNAFQIKRKAHAVSRKESSQSTVIGGRWNPFRHVWSMSHERSHTWDPEAQSGPIQNDVDDAGLSPIEPVLTAPPYVRHHADEEGGEDVGYQPERTESIGDTYVPSQDTGAPDFGLRKRKTDKVETLPIGHEEEKLKKKSHFKIVHPKEPFTFANQIQRTLLAGWINLLLVCVPAGITLNFVLGSSIPTFIVNFIAVIPLYSLTDLAMEELDMRLGRVLSIFLNISTR